ncbi:MAG TPA: hypothetical protein VF584_19725 [Longimicrobium sp.]
MDLLATRHARRPSIGRTIAVWALLLSGAGCGGRAPEAPAPGFSGELAAGARYVERLVAPRPASAMTAEEVISAGYVERLRLGLGSPFRLMEYALRDPRLTPATRVPLVWALLDATHAGRGYELDPRSLARVGDPGDSATARMHLELIDGAVRGAADPRSGELAAREAYRLATASRTVSQAAPALAASAAALARDRELARRDAARLLAHASRGGKHPFALLVEWRRARRFEVEAPPGAPRAPALEEEAAEQALGLVARVEAVRGAGVGAPAIRDGLPRLRPAVARRLAKLARDHSYPTQSPVWIAVNRYDEQLRRAARGRAGTRAAERLLRGRARRKRSPPSTP